MDKQKPRVLVICHTIFHYTLRSSEFREPREDVEGFKKWLHSRFIFDFIIEMSSESIHGEEFACTSKKVFDDVQTKLGDKVYAEGVANYLEAMKSVIFCVCDEKINELDIDDGIIVIADTLSNVGNYETFIVTDMKDKKSEKTLTYYQKYTGEEKPKIPFKILSLEETIAFLQGGYSSQFETVKQRDGMYNII